ncbi:MAG: PEP-CTERM sorting domain-containing protein [Acidobacteria bacterium]|nr:PEP-CTERM sorting domain-containing protein [Acidobacteriota bacterium]
MSDSTADLDWASTWPSTTPDHPAIGAAKARPLNEFTGNDNEIECPPKNKEPNHMNLRHTLSLAVLAAASITSLQAGLVSSSAGFTGTQVVDFNQFGYYSFSAGPTAVSNLVGVPVEFTATTEAAVMGSGGYGLGDNGYWNLTHAGLNSSSGYMQFTFLGGAVQAVGGFINYAPYYYGEAIIEAIGAGGTVLESYSLSNLAPISTPYATDGGAFRGIARNTADIEAFRLHNAFIVLDDLTFGGYAGSSISSTATPEPGSIGLAAAGLAALALTIRRKR